MAKKLPPSLDYLRPVVVDDLVRFGSSTDGGYLLPQRLIGEIDAVLSFGLATDWSFEEQLARLRPGIPIHVYDHTVGAKSYYRAAKSRSFKFLNGRTSFADVRMRWKTYTGYRHFFSGRHRHYAERVFNRRDNTNDATLDIAFGRLGAVRNVLLKVDIEGGEYRIVPAIKSFASRIDLLVIEFHDTDPFRPVFEAHIRSLLEHCDRASPCEQHRGRGRGWPARCVGDHFHEQAPSRVRAKTRPPAAGWFGSTERSEETRLRAHFRVNQAVPDRGFGRSCRPLP